MLQKESPYGYVDEECGNSVQNSHAGMCEWVEWRVGISWSNYVSLIRKHYKEYLIDKINQNHIDPLPLYREPGPLRAMLFRNGIRDLEQQVEEEEEEYCERLRQVTVVF